jgi:DNA-binding beta-propeller fold protein YncE
MIPGCAPKYVSRFFLILVLNLCVLALSKVEAWGSEFDDLTNTLGPTLTLMFYRHTTGTVNPDGTAINFWKPQYEGALALDEDNGNVSLSNPHMAAADAYNNIYIADKASHSILKLTPDGRVHTFAGTHTAGFNGDGPAAATNLLISNPNGLYVFPNGVVYLLDPGNHRIRRVGTDGLMTTIIDDPDPDWYPSGRALWVSPDEQLIYYTHEIKPTGTNTVTQGAVVKKWTRLNGIEIVCSQALGFRNPGNIAVNPIDNYLYVCDRAEDDLSKQATGLFRIDGPDQRTRITGNFSQPLPQDGQLAVNSFIEGPRGIAFRPDGSYFLCGHRDGSVWFVDTSGVIHRYLRGSGKGDAFFVPDGVQPPLTDINYFAQPRAVTLAPNGNLLVLANDSGFLFRVQDISTPEMPPDFHLGFAPDGVHLSWTGVFGRGYRVERTFDLSSGNWQPVTAGLGNAYAVPTDVVDPEPPANHAQAFYRLLPSL